MRKFYFINDKGERFDFSYKNKILVSSVSGLGFVKEIKYADFETMYKKLDEKNPTSDIVLTLVFLEKYKGFRRFLNYIEGSSNLLFYYQSDDLKYIMCEVESLSKTQIENGAITSEIKIKKLSYWFKDVVTEVNISVSKDGKIYPFTYPYKYSSSSKGSVKIRNHGYAKAPLKIVIEGNVNNPELIVSKDEVEVARLKIYYESLNSKIIIDSFPTRQEIKIIDSAGNEINGYEYQDFSCLNFIELNPGTYDLLFVPNIDSTPKCTITMVEGYLGN